MPPAGSGPAVFLAATHASPGMFLRDASQAIQLVADSVLARPADVAAALGKDEDKDLSKQALRIREDTAGLMGSALSESVRCDAARRAAAGGEAASASRKVWVHSAALAEVRAHAISVRPAAPEHASGGLVYDATTHSLVEAREGDCPTLLSPWGIAMTKAGRIRPRDDALDSRGPSRGSNETMEELVRRSEKEEEESGKRGQPVPAPLAGASRVVVQARVVFGTLECDAGKRVVAPLAELDEAEAVGIEGPAGWRGRQWSHPFGAADASRWGCIAGAQDGEAGDAAGGAADAASSDEEGSDEESRGRGPAASADDADPYAPTAVTSASGLARWWAGEESLARARSLAAVEAAVKADVGASESKDGSGAKQGLSRAAVLRRSAVEHAAVRTRMAAARAYAGAAAGSGRQGSQHAVWKDGPSTASLASGPLLGDEGVPSPLAGGEGKAPWSARQETALRGLVARYTHWHEATFEISLVRPAPSWGRSMGLARTGLDGDPRGDSEEGDDDDDDDDDDEHRAGGEGTSEERRAAALRRDLKRGVRADAPGRSGAGPVGAPRGLEAVLTRLVWEGKGLAGKGLRLFAEATGGVVLRGPDMVPEHGGWRLIGIDEAVPRGAWEADRRAAGAWEAAQGMAVASLTDGTDTDWTLGAEFLATLPAHMAARMGAADVGANHPTAVMSNVALLCRTQGPLMRHWPPAALGVVGNQRHIRAAMRERASWLDVEDDQDAAGGGRGKGEARAGATGADASEGGSDSEGAAMGSVQGRDGSEEEDGEEVPSPTEFGVGWHDGWEGLRPTEAMGQLVEMGQGPTLLLGDGRWAAMPTSTLYTWIGGEDEYAYAKRFASGFGFGQEGGNRGQHAGQSEQTEPDSDSDEGEEEEEEEEDSDAADAAVAVEDLISKPAPPAWAVAAVRQLATMADGSDRAPLGTAVTDLASRGVPVLYAPDASAGGDLPPGWAVSKGQYEGGLVQWECAGDAAAVIVGAAVAGSALSGPGGADEAGPKGLFAAGTAGAALGRAMAASRLTIVEVGCGTALPTAAALRLRALAPGSADQCTRAVLQDLNAPALSLKAGPSVAHAAELPQAGAAAAPAAPKEVRLLSGSWGAAMDDALADAAVAGCRDGGALVVVASETVYRAEAVAAHTASLLGLLERGRAAGMGPCVCVVAAKRFYFGSGLGGGTRAFAEAAEAWTPAGGGSRPVLWRALSVDDGKSNVRDVWVVSLSD